MKYSILIVTCKDGVETFLDDCISSIEKTTILDNSIEIIVVGSGLTDEGKEYFHSLESKPYNIKTFEYEDPVGHAIAANKAASMASGEYLIKLDDDTQILDWGKDNEWIRILEEPFHMDVFNTGITGSTSIIDPCIKRYLLIGFVLMIKKSLFDDVLGYNETFYKTQGDDADLCWKVEDIGYDLIVTPQNCLASEKEGSDEFLFPIYHVSNAVFFHDDFHKIRKRNQQLLNLIYMNPIAYANYIKEGK